MPTFEMGETIHETTTLKTLTSITVREKFQLPTKKRNTRQPYIQAASVALR